MGRPISFQPHCLKLEHVSEEGAVDETGVRNVRQWFRDEEQTIPVVFPFCPTAPWKKKTTSVLLAAAHLPWQKYVPYLKVKNPVRAPPFPRWCVLAQQRRRFAVSSAWSPASGWSRAGWPGSGTSLAWSAPWQRTRRPGSRRTGGTWRGKQCAARDKEDISIEITLLLIRKLYFYGPYLKKVTMSFNGGVNPHRTKQDKENKKNIKVVGAVIWIIWLILWWNTSMLLFDITFIKN